MRGRFVNKALYRKYNIDTISKKKQKKEQDRYGEIGLLSAVTLLIIVGIVMIYSASGVTTSEKYHFVFRQVFFAFIGYSFLTAILFIPIHILQRIQYLLVGFSLILLCLVFTPLGLKINGASRWIHIAGFTLQPMEFAKIALIFYCSYFIGTKQEYLQSFSKGLLPPVIVTAMMCILLIFQPDFGSVAVFFLLLFILYFVGGGNKFYLVLIFLFGIIALTLLVIFSPYRVKRVLAFLDPFEDATNTGYQVVQSLYAVASGGLTGLGLGEGKQKLYYLPEAHNDFIFAVIAEELGFIGVSIIFSLYVFIFVRAFSISLRQQNLQNMLLTFGVTIILAMSTIFNIGVVVGLFPPKGIALPFLSYGGSNLVASCICIGILMRFSKNI